MSVEADLLFLPSWDATSSISLLSTRIS